MSATEDRLNEYASMTSTLLLMADRCHALAHERAEAWRNARTRNGVPGDVMELLPEEAYTAGDRYDEVVVDADSQTITFYAPEPGAMEPTRCSFTVPWYVLTDTEHGEARYRAETEAEVAAAVAAWAEQRARIDATMGNR